MKQDTTEIRKDNKKALPKMLLVTLLCAGLGALVGVGSAVMSDSIDLTGLPQMLSAAIQKSLPFGIPVCGVLTLIPAVLLLHQVKKLFAGWDGEEETYAERMEYLLTWSMVLAGLLMPIAFFFLSAALVYIETGNVLLVAGEMILVLAGVVFVQQKAVDLTRMLNPEKKGSVYDTNFQKKWLESCDENERRQIGEAAFHSFKAVNITCVGLWIVLTVGQTVFQTGILPIVVVLLIWGVLQGSYFAACLKTIRKKKKAD